MSIVLAGTATLTGSLTVEPLDNSGAGMTVVHDTVASGYSDGLDNTHLQLTTFDDFGNAVNADGACYVYGSLSLPTINYPIDRIEFGFRTKSSITVTHGDRLGSVIVKGYVGGDEIGILNISAVTGFSDFSVTSNINQSTGLAWTIQDLSSPTCGFVVYCQSSDPEYNTSIDAWIAEYKINVYVSTPDAVDKLTTSSMKADSLITLKSTRTGINARRVVSDPLIER